MVMKFDSKAAFPYLLYHEILQLQKDSTDKKDEASRWYRCKCRLGHLLFKHEGLLLVHPWYYYDSPQGFYAAMEPSTSCDNESQVREVLQYCG